MSRDKNRRETMFISQLSRNYPHRGGNFERGKVRSLVGKRQFGGHVRRLFGPRVIASQNCLETVGGKLKWRTSMIDVG